MFNTISGVLSHMADPPPASNHNSKPTLNGMKFLFRLAGLAAKAKPNTASKSNKNSWTFQTKSPKVLKAFVINVYNDSKEKKKTDKDEHV
jgi:hypothetical protein